MLNSKRRGIVLVISSPSGAGKTTICKKLIKEIKGVTLSISATTRKKRKNEIHGKEMSLGIIMEHLSKKFYQK
jgi:guanylate kinase